MDTTRRTLLVRRRFLWAVLPMALGTLSSACGASPSSPGDPQTRYEVPPQTGDGWSTASAATVGMSVESLEALLDQIEGTANHMIHGLLVVRHGHLVLESYWPGQDLRSTDLEPVQHDFDRETLHYVASVSKSVTSMLTGIAVDGGYIESVDAPVFDYFPDYAGLARDDNVQVTLRTLLSFSSGYDWNEFEFGFDDPRDSHNQMFAAADPIEYLLGRAMVASPGEAFLYNSGDTNLMGEVVRRATSSSTLPAFADERLFGPLGITQYTWVMFGRALQVAFASGGLSMRPRDMAKLGQLYLDHGVWNGVQVVSPAWVDASVALSTPLTSRDPDHDGYGFNWWLGSSRYGSGTVDFYHALGWGGQDVFVYPALDLVVVFTRGGYYERMPLSATGLLEQYILAAIEG